MSPRSNEEASKAYVLRYAKSTNGEHNKQLRKKCSSAKDPRRTDAVDVLLRLAHLRKYGTQSKEGTE